MVDSRIKIVLIYAVFATIWIFGSDRLLAQLIRDPVLLGWIGTGKGVAFVAVTSLLLYLLLRIWEGAAIPREAPSSTKQIGRLFGLFLSLSLVVPLLGYGIYQFYRPQIRESAFADLDAIASLKSSQIEAWLLQRQNNARVLAYDPELARNVALLLRAPSDDVLQKRIHERLDALHQVYGYDVILLDAAGRQILTVGQHPELSGAILHDSLPLALKSGHVQRSELYRDASGGIHLDYVVPLHHQQGVSAAVLLHTPVEHFLFPLIQRWPTPSPSAETMLVRRDGDKVLYLNELRHQRHTALTLRVPLSAHSPSSLAVQTGGVQHMETRDRRGVPVLAASRPIAGTTWFVVAKIDRDEVLAPLKRLALWISLITLAAVIALSAAILLLWRQQQRAHRLELISQNADRDRLLKLFFDLPFVGMSITSPVTKRWQHVNDRLCEMLGYPREELLTLTWAELTYPDDLAADMGEFERALKGEIDAYQMDKRFVRKNGTIVDTTLNVKAVRYPDGGVEWFVATIQDISARRRMEGMQRGHALVLESLVKNQPLTEVLSHLTDLISSVLPGAIGSIWLLDEDGKHLRRGAVKGLPEFFSRAVDGVEIGEGVGSCGTAAFRGKRVIVEDSFVSPLWDNYRDLATRAKLGACWSQPILASDARVLGTFAVYFPQPSRFDADNDKLLRSAANMAALAIQSKRAEAAQKTLSERIETMLESMIDGFVAMDKDWRYLYVNRHAASLLGRDPASLIGKNIWDEFPEGVGQPFYHTYQRVMAQQKPEQIEDYYPPWNRWFENRIYPTSDGITIYFQDITERKQMEANLRESEARFRAIIDTEPECVKMIGPDGKLNFMNRAGLDMIEADSLEQVQGKSVLKIITPEYQEAFARLTQQVLQGERGVLEFEIIGLKGTRRFLETHAVSLRTSEAEPYSLLGITRDITQRKEMEDQVRQQLAELLRWQEIMLGREGRVQQLKSEVNALLIGLGQPVRYPSQESA